MSVSINSNIAASTTLRHLDRATESLRRSFERLSSGLRINRASDDAAGLSISEGLNVSARVSERGRANVNDGISALQIAGGATEQISNLLTRMAELAEQASSGTIGSAQRKSLNKEYQALDKEIRRIAATTSFNGQKLLQGTQNAALNYTQITNTTGAGIDPNFSVISSDARYVTYKNFSSNSLQQYDVETGTVTTIASVLPADLAASAAGDRVVWVQAVAGRAEVLMWDRNTGQTTQITNSQGGEFISDLTISADGSTVAFGSFTTYVEGGTKDNPSGYNPAGWGLYTVDLASGTYHVAHAQTPGVSYLNLSLSASGSYLSFASNSQITGGNGDGNAELFVRDLSDFTASGLHQITATTGAEQPAGMVSDSGDVYWLSAYNLIGSNASLSTQIYHYSTQSGTTTQLTSNQTGNPTIYSLSMSPDGSRLTFASGADLINNPSAPLPALQTFELDLQSNTLTQKSNIAANPSVTALSGYSGDGQSYLVASTSNLTGGNADGNTELFIIDTSMASLSLSISTGSGHQGLVGVLLEEIDGALRGLGGHQLTTQGAARGALDATKLNISKINKVQGEIGANLSRLGYAANVIETSVLEQQAARSRITDVDVAGEAAALTRSQILQQAGSAVLAQANLQPSIALKLLSFDS